MCGFDEIQKGNYFREEPVRRTEVEVRVGKLNIIIIIIMQTALQVLYCCGRQSCVKDQT